MLQNSTKTGLLTSQIYLPTLGEYYDVSWTADGWGITSIVNIMDAGVNRNCLLEIPGFKQELIQALIRRTKQIRRGKEKYHSHT